MKRISLFLAVLIVINALFVSVAGAEYITRAEAARLLYGLLHMEYDYIPERLDIQKKSEFSDVAAGDKDYDIINEMSAAGLFKSTGCFEEFKKDMYVTEGFAKTMLKNAFDYHGGKSNPFSYSAASGYITKQQFSEMLDILYGAIETVKTAPVPDGAGKSGLYTVTVNGQDAGVYKTYAFSDGDIKTGEIKGRPVTEVAAAYFDFFGTVTVDITSLCGNIRGQDLKIRPLSEGIEPKVSGNKISFEISKPCNISIEPFGLSKPLHLFANPVDKRLPDFSADNVLYYGAGVHYIDPTALSDNTTVYVDAGAVVYTKPQEKSTQGDKVYGYDVSFIDSTFNAVRGDYQNGGRIKNITIRGRGVISGANTLEKLQRHKLIELYGVENAYVDGVMLLESSGWSLAVFHSDGVYINNVKIIGHYANNDGIDFCDSKNGIIENCFAHNADDSFLIKAWFAVDNVTFRRCTAWNDVSTSFGAVCELYQPITNILYEDCTVIHSTAPCWTEDSGGVIGIWNCGGSDIDKFTFNNIAIEDCVSGKEPIKINVADSAEKSCLIKNVFFRNISILNAADTRIALKSPFAHGIRDISFNNVVINGKRVENADNFIIRNAEDITVSDKLIKYFTENLAFKAKARVYKSDGSTVEGGHEAHPQRASLSALNNYDIDAANGWYTYIAPISELPIYLELDYAPIIASINKITIGSASAAYGIKSLEIEAFDGESWKTVPLLKEQAQGITLSGNGAQIDIANPSRTETNSAGTRTQYFYDIRLADTCNCIKLRLKILRAQGSGYHWGMLPIDEVLTYGYAADSTDAAEFEHFYDMTESLSKNCFAMDKTQIYSYAEQIGNTALKRQILNRLDNCGNGVFNIAENASAVTTAGQQTAENLNDGSYENGWESKTTAAGSVIILDYKRPVMLYDISFVQRYYPDCVYEVDIYAEYGGKRFYVEKNAVLNHTNVPELAWYSGGYTPLEKEAYSYYELNGLLRADKGEINYYDKQKLDFANPVFCDKIYIEVKKANTAWDTYGIREIETNGRYADVPSVFDAEMCVKNGNVTAVFNAVPCGDMYAVLTTEKDGKLTGITVEKYTAEKGTCLFGCTVELKYSEGEQASFILLSDLENIVPIGKKTVLN